MKAQNYRLVKVVWEDARTIDGTLCMSEVERTLLALCHTIGYLIMEDKEKVVVCSYRFISDSMDFQDGFRHTHLIPKSCIKKIINLGEKK